MTRAPMIRERLLPVLAAVTLGLAACAPGPGADPSMRPLTPTSRWSLQVEEGLDRIALAAHPTGVSDNQHAALAALVGRFVVNNGDVIRVEAPYGADPVAGDMAWRIREALQAQGVPAERIIVQSYAAPDPAAPVLAGYALIRAQVPRCGTQWESLTRTGSNQTPSNFGCAVNANMAAQIADPRDIVGARGLAQADAGRRTVVIDNYRAGESTSAPQETLVQSRISQAVD